MAFSRIDDKRPSRHSSGVKCRRVKKGQLQFPNYYVTHSLKLLETFRFEDENDYERSADKKELSFLDMKTSMAEYTKPQTNQELLRRWGFSKEEEEEEEEEKEDDDDVLQ
ncbi:unnamed protein product [Porites lobata]|uniref:Uncharacterized protein n=1 Tax=Porites lobata TaxID=104759 RepID=A0ABN8P382_9CNID|nr:unnamed protein product [Porites lobata]